MGPCIAAGAEADLRPLHCRATAMSFVEIAAQPIERVPLHTLGNVPTSPPEEWATLHHLSTENLTLSFVKQCVVVLELQPGEAAQLRSLHQHAANYLFGDPSQQPLMTPAAASFVPLPGARTVTFQPNSPHSTALPANIKASCHQVIPLARPHGATAPGGDSKFAFSNWRCHRLVFLPDRVISFALQRESYIH